jgi:hypothetical protein
MPNLPFTRNIPDGPNNPSSDQPIMQENSNSTDTLLNVDLHGFNDDNGGFHRKSTYVAVAAPGVTPLNTNGAQCIAYSTSVAGIAELFVNRFGSATPLQLTRGAISATGSFSGNPSSGYSSLPGGIRIQWGSITAVSTGTGTAFSFPVPFTTLFSLTGAIQAAGVQRMCFRSVSTTGASAQCESGSQTINWIAIGV